MRSVNVRTIAPFGISVPASKLTSMSEATAHNDDRLPALDGLRGFAALFVMFYHLTMQVEPHTVPAIAFKNLFSFGWTGVDLFFVLSGFLITGLLVSAKGSTNYFRVFYARRTLRILPLYYLALIVLFGVPMIIRLPHDFVVPFRDQLWFWFYLQNFHWLGSQFAGLTGPLWSLAIEEQFYLVWPLVVLLTSRRQALWVCAGCLAVSLIYRTYAVTTIPHLDTYYVTQARLDGLAIGSGIALLTREGDWLERLRKYVPATTIAALITLAAIGANIRGDHRPLYPLLYLAIAVFYGGILVVALSSGASGPWSFLKSRLLRFYGRYSYALYVVHVPVMTVLWHVGITPPNLSLGGSDLIGAVLYIVVIVPVATLLAWLSWHLFEKHFLKLKRNFVYERAAKNAKAPLLAAPLTVE